MNGQWIGKYIGTDSGDIILNIDDRGLYFQGVAYLTGGQGIPTIGARFQTADKSATFAFSTENIWVINPETSNRADWDQVKKHFPDDMTVPKRADVTGQCDQLSLKLVWQTDIGTSGSCELSRSQADQPSDLVAQKMTWADFKAYVSMLAGSRHLFRGQREPWRLRTAFHRTRRADLIRFVDEDIAILHQHLSVRTKHLFNRNIPEENGAFFNLVQHHGYPTPLLDWTYSPFVAAFFAYRDVSRSEAAQADPTRRVRVFVLDQRWRTEIRQIFVADCHFRHFSIAEFLAIDNERMIPQQSISAITNVDDIETYIREMEAKFGNGRPYLTAIDLPAAERAAVYRELGYMGVTAGALFPGLDGACEALRDRNF